ncbi:microtubule cross-linking factor 1 isoform X1 [Lethenteron reissneri]|uniref:microtubule cross-linking factor 1 isoform X1 n=1 Tax=Lethenteron reissneri TaxID=7753 RepID=UPI002AB6DB89|nr:microtubule cross-linking factor 1 isoform X1 [Lethenteron reissneri]
MEAVSGGSAAAASSSPAPASADPPRPQHPEQKRSSNRTPSPARPRGGHARLSTGTKPGLPTKPGASKAGLSPARLARRSPAKEKAKHVADTTGSSGVKPGAASSSSSTSSSVSSCSSGGAPRATKSFLVRLSSAELKAKKIVDCKAAAVAVAAARLRRKVATAANCDAAAVVAVASAAHGGTRTPRTDSGSDLSDCVSEPLSVSDEQGGGGGGGDPNISDRHLDELRESAEDCEQEEEEGATDGAHAETAAAAAYDDDDDVETATSAAADAGAAGKADVADWSDSGMEAESADSPSELRSSLRADEDASGELAESCSSATDARSSRHGEMCGLEEEEFGFLDQEIFREMEELRSENTYLKDELEELRTEMEEMRDSYLEEDAQHVQDLRRELDRAHKSCRILQYRLRKAERRSLRALAAAHSGHSDGELIRAFEQDLKVAKDVSVRLHRELESVEDRRVRAEDENDTLRAKLIQLEVAKQALQNEMDKMKESSLRRRGSRELYKPEKRPLSQEDNADLKCQLQFLKEEAALMRRKMVRVGKERDRFEQELQKYKASYGDLDGPLTAGDGSSAIGGGPPSTRETELKLRLRLVEEEATVLSRKIVELEVENGGLKSEMEEMKCHCEKGSATAEGSDADDHRSCISVDGDLGESACELRRHLQFVEEEAEVLRRSVVELEEQNRLLTEELGRSRPGSDPEGDWDEEMSESGPPSSESLQEELDIARSKIGQLSGKLAKFQYENRILLSKAQGSDLVSQASHKESTDGSLEDLGEPSQMRREGPVGGEGENEDHREEATSQMENDMNLLLRRYEEPRKLARFRSEAERLGKVIESLISDTESLIGEAKDAMPCGEVEDNDGEASFANSGPQLLDKIDARMRDIGKELKSFIEKLDISADDAADEDNTCTRDTFSHFSLNRDHTLDFQSELEDQASWDEHSVDKACNLTPADKTSSGALHERIYGKTDSVESELRESQEVLSEANMTIQQLQVQLEQERQYRREENQHLEKQISLLKAEQRKLALRRDFELQSVRLQQKLERRELARARGSLVQEVRCLRQGLALVCARLRAVVRHWRQGRKDLGLGDEAFLDLDGAADLSLVLVEKDLLEDLSEASNTSESTEDSGVHSLLEGLAEKRDSLTAMECLGKWEQQGRESRRVLLELRSVLEDLQSEFREEERSRSELQREFATEKATWEMERAQFKFVLSQLQADISSSGEEPPLPEQLAEQQKALLADMHGRTLELRRQLHAGERGWGRERTELLQRFDHERKDWEQQLRLMRHKVHQLQKEKPSHAASGLAQHLPGVSSGLRSEQGKVISILRCGPDAHMLKDIRPRAFESLVLDALSLDSPNREALRKAPMLGQNEVKLFRRTNSEELGEDTDGKTGLRRARSSSSINDFDAQMDSAPYLPEKSSPTNSDPLFIKIDGVSHPLSPDDLKYIEEFAARRRVNDATHDRWSSDGQESEQALLQDGPAESEGHSSWYLTTGVDMSGGVLADAELRAQQIMGFGPEEAERDGEGYYGRRSPRGSDAAQPEGDAGDGGYSFLSPHRRRAADSRWSSELLGRRSDSSESGIASDIQTSSAAETEASRNMSDDMKEAAFGTRTGAQGGGGDDDDEDEDGGGGGRPTRDTASQTASASTTGTQTVRTMVNVCAQTEYVRGLSSHRAAVLQRATSQAVLGSPRSSLGARGKVSAAVAAASPLDKMDARFERNCCSKFSSPRFPRKAPAGRAEQARYGRDSPLSRLDSLKGQSESAWARSTTTRDSPVHTTSNHGLSSLFTFIDHSTEVPGKAGAKPGGKEPVRSRSVDMSRSNYGLIQEILKNARDRSLSPNSNREQRICAAAVKSCFGSPKREVPVTSPPRAREALGQSSSEPAAAKSCDQDDAGENSTDKPTGNTPESPSSRESAAARRSQKSTSRTFQPRWPPRDSSFPSPVASSKKPKSGPANASCIKPSADAGGKQEGEHADIQGELEGGGRCSQSRPQETGEHPEGTENGASEATENEAAARGTEETSTNMTLEIDQEGTTDVDDNLGGEDKDLRDLTDDDDEEEDPSGISINVYIDTNAHSDDDDDYSSADKPESNNELIAHDEGENPAPDDAECIASMPDDEQTFDDPAEEVEFNTDVANDESPFEDTETCEPDGGNDLENDADDTGDLDKVEELEEKENDSEAESERDQLEAENSEDGNDPTA